MVHCAEIVLEAMDDNIWRPEAAAWITEGVRAVETCGKHVSTAADALGPCGPSRYDTAAPADTSGSG